VDAATALAQALLLRRGDTYVDDVLIFLAAAGFVVVHLPTTEEAEMAILHQQWHAERRHREWFDAQAVLDLIRGRP
jgi:hypothetical protein